MSSAESASPSTPECEVVSPSGNTTLDPIPSPTASLALEEDDTRSVTSSKYSVRSTFSTLSTLAAAPVNCQGCEEKLATSFCKDCNFVFCAECLEDSHKVRAFRKHIIMEVSKKPKDSSLCQMHRESKRVWCDSCGDLICILCATAGTHKTHKTELVADMARRIKPETCKLQEQLRVAEAGLHEQVLAIDKDILRVNTESQSLEDEIQSGLTTLQTLLDSIQEDVLGQLGTNKEKALASLLSKKTALTDVKENITAMFREEPSSDDDVLSVAYNFTLRKLLEQIKPGSLIEEIGSFQISCNLVSLLEECIRNLAAVSIKFEASRVGLRILHAEAHKLAVQLLPPTGPAVSHYQLQFKLASAEEWTDVVVASDLRVELEGLRPHALYTLQARAENLEWGAPVEVMTGMPRLHILSAQYVEESKLSLTLGELSDVTIDELEVEILREAANVEEKVEEEWISARKSSPISLPTVVFEAVGAAQWEAMTVKARLRIGSTWSEFTSSFPVNVIKTLSWHPSRFSRRKCGAGMKVQESGALVEQKESDNWTSCLAAEGIDTSSVEGVFRWKLAVELLPKLHNVMFGIADSSHPLDGEYLGKSATTWALYSEVSASKKDKTLFNYHQKKKEAMRGKLQSGDEVMFELRSFAGAKPAELSVKISRKDAVVVEKILFADVSGKVYPAVCAHTKGFKVRLLK